MQLCSRSWIWMLAACVWLFGCGPASTDLPAAKSDPAGRGYPGTLLPVSQLAPDFQWRQRVTATWQDQQHQFEAVLAKEQDALRLIGLGPMNTPGFIITLKGQNIELEKRALKELSFEPRWILLDIQRAFYPWFLEGPLESGRREKRVDGEIVRESWQDGTLRERRFSRAGGSPPGEIVVHYRGWQPEMLAPRKARLQNGWFGYSLLIETLEQQLLSPDSTN